jgi:hypothetical protein
MFARFTIDEHDTTAVMRVWNLRDGSQARRRGGMQRCTCHGQLPQRVTRRDPAVRRVASVC